MNFYEILEADPLWTDAKLKAQYRKMAQKHHPDKGGDPNRMQAINRAWATLGDHKKRDAYDRRYAFGQYAYKRAERAEKTKAKTKAKAKKETDAHPYAARPQFKPNPANFDIHGICKRCGGRGSHVVAVGFKTASIQCMSCNGRGALSAFAEAA